MVLKTSALTLVYDSGDSDGKFTADDLTVSFSLNGKEVVWKPGIQHTGNFWALSVRSILPGVE